MFDHIKSMEEDIHGIALDGLHRDNAPDIQRVLAGHLRNAIFALDDKVGEIKQRLGEVHD